jgi:glycosyltransferase involved in cell wall biosynthesis
LKLIILGDGSYRSNLEKLTDELDLKNNVLFKGYISGIEKKIFLSESQALVFPSLSEGFGMVILEAYMQKKPVLISNIRPLTDIVENEKTGLIVAQNNEKFWADTIEKIIKEPQKTSNMGHYCREFLEQNYSLELISEKFLKMCKEVIMK